MRTQTWVSTLSVAVAAAVCFAAPSKVMAGPNPNPSLTEEERRADERRRDEELAKPPYIPPEPEREYLFFPDIGASILLGAGVTNFSDPDINGMSSVGGGWNAKLTIGTHRYLAVEAQYLGTASTINALGLDNNAVLLANGAQGDLRLNFTTTWVQPFIYGGAAIKHYAVTNTNVNTSDVNDSDNVWEIPAGVGVAMRYQHFVLEPRFDYRFAFDDELVNSFDANGDRTTDLGNWSLTANVGVDF